jgi:hypothetical protein
MAAGGAAGTRLEELDTGEKFDDCQNPENRFFVAIRKMYVQGL